MLLAGVDHDAQHLVVVVPEPAPTRLTCLTFRWQPAVAALVSGLEVGDDLGHPSVEGAAEANQRRTAGTDPGPGVLGHRAHRCPPPQPDFVGRFRHRPAPGHRRRHLLTAAPCRPPAGNRPRRAARSSCPARTSVPHTTSPLLPPSMHPRAADVASRTLTTGRCLTWPTTPQSGQPQPGSIVATGWATSRARGPLPNGHPALKAEEPLKEEKQRADRSAMRLVRVSRLAFTIAVSLPLLSTLALSGPASARPKNWKPTSTTVASTTTSAAAPTTAVAKATTGTQLSWRPPALTSPINLVIDDATAMPLYLDSVKDYVIKLGHRTKTHGVVISGGRNIVMIGGRISIPYAGESPSIEARRGLYLERNSGTVHIEGLLIDGPDLSEGIQIAAPAAIVQLQNVRVIGVHARDQVNFSDNHPDCLQPWGGVQKILIDRMTCTTDTHGMYFDSNDARRLGGPIGYSDIRRYNIKRTLKSPHWAFQRVTADGDQPMTLTDVYVEPESTTSLYNSVGSESWRSGVYNFLPASISADGATASWPQDTALTGAIKKGPPPAGDFAPAGLSGTSYVSPGYG